MPDRAITHTGGSSMNIEIVGPVNEPGFRGYKVYVDGVHVRTERLLRDARKFVEALA